jgi:hypothetical protein
LKAIMKSEAEAEVHVENVGGVLRETFDIKGRLKRNPYGMVAGAVGMGFVLGGGLFTRLAARILGTGLRIGLIAALPILEKQIVQALTGSKLDTRQENDQ